MFLMPIALFIGYSIFIVLFINNLDIRLTLLGFIALSICISLISLIFLKYSDRYHIRPIKNYEYEYYKGLKLIHYTNVISESDLEYHKKYGELALYGNCSARSNYRMRFKEKKYSFIWFHQANNINSSEPDFDSFVESHFFEKSPRQYKVIIDFDDIKDNKLYINPVTGNILVNNEKLCCKADLHDEFNWFNDRVYYKKLIRTVLKSFFVMVPLALNQSLGTIIDKVR